MLYMPHFSLELNCYTERPNHALQRTRRCALAVAIARVLVGRVAELGSLGVIRFLAVTNNRQIERKYMPIKRTFILGSIGGLLLGATIFSAGMWLQPTSAFMPIISFLTW